MTVGLNIALDSNQIFPHLEVITTIEPIKSSQDFYALWMFPLFSAVFITFPRGQCSCWAKSRLRVEMSVAEEVPLRKICIVGILAYSPLRLFIRVQSKTRTSMASLSSSRPSQRCKRFASWWWGNTTPTVWNVTSCVDPTTHLMHLTFVACCVLK